MIKISTLDNGIRVVTDSSKSAESVKLGVWVKCGSRCENEKQNGISHVLEHMAFKGTKKRSALDISSTIENAGGFVNACTSDCRTYYYTHVLKENLDLGLDILADILQNSVMDQKELSKEKAVILQEINRKNDIPSSVIWDLFRQTAYPGQPIGRPVLGDIQTVFGISSKDLLNYIHQQYTPDRIVISASGSVEHQKFLEVCEKLFSKIKPKKAPSVVPATYIGGDFRENRSSDQVNLVLGFKGVSIFDPDYYTAQILSGILGSGMSSRLFQEIREKRGLVYTIFSHNYSRSDTGEFSIYAGTGEKGVNELMPVLCDEIVQITDKILPVEMKRSKARLLASLLIQQDNILEHAETNANSLLFLNRIRSKKEIKGAIESITTKQVKALAHRIFSTKPTFTAIGPIKNVMKYEEIIDRLQQDKKTPSVNV